MVEKANAEARRMPGDGNYEEWEVKITGLETGVVRTYDIAGTESSAVTEAFRRFAAEQEGDD